MVFPGGDINAIATNAQEAAADDRPLVMARNVLQDNNAEAIWNSAGTFTGGETDITDPLFPTSNLYNGSLHLGSQPTASAADPLYVNFDLNDVTADALMLKLLFISSVGSFDIDIEADATNAFPSPTNIVSFNGITQPAVPFTSPRRLVSLVLVSSPAKQLTNLRWLRIAIARASGSGNIAPRIGEFYLAQRRQLAHKMNRPYDDKPRGADARDHMSRGRSRQRVVHSKRYRDLDGNYLVSTAAGKKFSATFDDDATWDQIYIDNDNTKAVVWVEDPNTSPDVALMGFLPPELRKPETGYTRRNLDFQLGEIPPFRLNEP
jgi:hypothetical protein